jgi:hypothetical protein
MSGEKGYVIEYGNSRGLSKNQIPNGFTMTAHHSKRTVTAKLL